jgi:hypothetical protein
MVAMVREYNLALPLWKAPVLLWVSLLDRHRVDADPDPTFDFDVNLDLNPERHQNDADPHSGPSQGGF